MADGDKSLLTKVLLLSKVDATLARLFAERKKIENDLASKLATLKKTEGDLKSETKNLAEKRFRFQRDDKVLKEEREKLVARRKALASLGTHKTQQAAAREIEHLGRDLTSKEELLLNVMGEIEALEKRVASIQESLDTQTLNLEEADKEGKATLVNIEERRSAKQIERDALAREVDPQNLTIYNRSKERFPMDPAVPITNGTCAGCFIQVVPQLVVQVSKGDTLIKCRGCARILYIDEKASEEKIAV